MQLLSAQPIYSPSSIGLERPTFNRKVLGSIPRESTKQGVLVLKDNTSALHAEEIGSVPIRSTILLRGI